MSLILCYTDRGRPCLKHSERETYCGRPVAGCRQVAATRAFGGRWTRAAWLSTVLTLLGIDNDFDAVCPECQALLLARTKGDDGEPDIERIQEIFRGQGG